MRRTTESLWTWILMVGLAALVGFSVPVLAQDGAPPAEAAPTEAVQADPAAPANADAPPAPGSAQVAGDPSTTPQDAALNAPPAEAPGQVAAPGSGDPSEVVNEFEPPANVEDEGPVPDQDGGPIEADLDAEGGEEAVEGEGEVCENECEIGDRMCSEDGGAMWCVHRGECRVWTPELTCQENQECKNGRCGSAAGATVIWIGIALMLLAFVYIVWSYAKGMKGSPREIYILFGTKVIEYTAYGAMNMTFVLFLSDSVGLSDIKAGGFISMWSLGISLTTMFVGALVDAIGVKKTLIIGTVTLLIGRFFLPMMTGFWPVAILSFVPMAVGTAIMGPVISVGIKKYTTKEGAALGFGLFYTLMNVGWAAGAWLFDFLRERLGEHGTVNVPMYPEMTTYQFIFLVGFLLTIPTFFMILMMRKGIERTETGIVVREFRQAEGSGTAEIMVNTVKNAVVDTGKIIGSVVTEKAFWVFMFMLGTLLGVKLVFFHFHYTFPKYGIRVLGEGAKIGAVYGVLNPVLIVFIVPIISSLTKKVSSYKMMIIGTTLSAFSVFIAVIPPETFSFMEHGLMGELIYDRWLNVAADGRTPLYMSLTVFIIVFTIGEAFWSPRLMQFTAEIAPEGKEGTYISLSILPMFLAKFVAGPMSGWLVQTYTPVAEDGTVLPHPDHLMVWVWVGAVAITSPIALVVFNKMFTAAERKRDEEHRAHLEAVRRGEEAPEPGDEAELAAMDGDDGDDS